MNSGGFPNRPSIQTASVMSRKVLTGSMISLTRLVNQQATQAERLETRVKVLGTFYDDLVKQLRRL